MPVWKQLRQSDADKEAKMKVLGEGLEKEKKMLVDARQRLSEREMVIAAQTKSIQEMADKLRAKETELRGAVDQQKSLGAASARQAAELQRVESELDRATTENNILRETVRRLETSAETWKTEREELERKAAKTAAVEPTFTTVDSEKRALLDEIQQLRDQLTAHDGCSRERVRLEREMKMLNETLYSSIADKNKSTLEYKLLQDKLTAERERFAVHERQCTADRDRLEADIRKLTGCSGSRRASADHQATVDVDRSRSQSELDGVERQTAAAREELVQLTAEKERLTCECAATSERLQAKLSRLKSLQVLCMIRILLSSRRSLAFLPPVHFSDLLTRDFLTRKYSHSFEVIQERRKSR